MVNDNRRYSASPYTKEELACALADRHELLRALQDFDSRTKSLREPQTFDQPTLGIRDTPRKCSVCKEGLTYYTTGRHGRSVHPACGGWRDALTPMAEANLMFTVSAMLPVKSVEVIE